MAYTCPACSLTSQPGVPSLLSVLPGLPSSPVSHLLSFPPDFLLCILSRRAWLFLSLPRETEVFSWKQRAEKPYLNSQILKLNIQDTPRNAKH